MRFAEHGNREHVVLWRTGQMPIGDAFEVNAAFGSLEIVYIGYRPFFVACRCKAGDELSKFGREGEIGWSFCIDAGKHVDKLGDERSFMSIIQVEPPDAVACWFVAEVILLCQRLLAQIHKGCPYIEVGLYFIVDMSARHSLGHHAERVILATHANGSAARKYAFVHNTHGSHRVIHRIVHIFNQWHTSGCHSDRTRGDTVSQRNLPTDRTGEIAFQIELVTVGILLG